MNASHPSLVVMDGSDAGVTLSIDEVLNDFSIGSDEDCDLTLSGEQVSPLHATCFLDDEGLVTLSDTKSRAGVFVNGVKVMEHTLADGDEVVLGASAIQGARSLRFVAAGSELPAVDPSGPALLKISGFDGGDSTASDAPLRLPEIEMPALTASVADPFPPPEALLGAEPVPEEAALPDLFADAGVLPAIGETPTPVADPLPEPNLEPLPEPEAFPALDVLPEPDSPEPGIAPEPEPEPAPAPAPPPPPAAVVSKTQSQKRTAAVKRAAEDPFSDLAESLGGGERSVPPPPIQEARVPPGPQKKAGASPAAMAGRVAIVAVILAGAAWFATRKYAESVVLPVVESYQPNPAEPGQTVTITGSGFGSAPDPTLVKVMLGGAAVEVLDANPTRLNITVPESLGAAGSQTLPLTVTAQDSTSTSRLLKIVVPPRIASLSPRVALTGDEVTVVGQWLANAKTRPTASVAGQEAEILEAAPDRVRIKVPQVMATEGQMVSVRIAVGPDVSKEAPLYFGRLPFIEAVTPARAFPGDVATVTGLGLSGPDVSATVGGRTAVILTSTETALTISVPGIRLSEGPGRRDLSVRVNQRSSSALPLEVLRESSAMYLPRFFPEGTSDGRIALSIELGPLFLLGGDAASKARAHEAATKLNALASRARANRVLFTSAGPVISGPSGPVLTLAAGDGAGNPSALAGLWAAELSDVFDLFFQGRRPSQTVGHSPSGRVFLDIFAAARRRSSAPGVPPAVLFSPDPSWLKALSALSAAPAFGSSEAMALVDGYWSGDIVVPGAIQPRKIEISLTATPGGLVGQRTSRQGRLSTDVSLGGLRYSNHELRFSFVDSGENLNYVGRLDGDTIDGNVTRASGARVGRLTFTLTR